MSISLVKSKPAKVDAGVYGPAQMGRVHVRFQIMEICLGCGKYVIFLAHHLPWRLIGSNLERESYPDERLSTEALMGLSVCNESFCKPDSDSGDSERGPNGDDKGLGSPVK